MEKKLLFHLSLEMALFSLFHLVLKSLQNSNQSIKTWHGRISCSPERGFIPKYCTRSWKLRDGVRKKADIKYILYVERLILRLHKDGQDLKCM